MGSNQYLENIISKEEVNEIISMYNNNVSLRELEKRVPYSRQALARMLERLGAKTTSGNHYRKYFFDFNFFEKIDSEIKAYWLGFMYADGCVLPQDPRGYGEQEFKISVGKKDLEILEKFKEDIKSTYPIREDASKNRKNENYQVQVLQSLRSQKTVEDLKRLGCVENKSLILTFPTEEQVPKEFIYDFIRGYFDGDGSISEHNGAYLISIIGTENFIKTLSTYFEGGSVLPDKRKNNSWYFSLGGNLQVIKAYHLLYDNKTRFMDRKYQKFQLLLQKYGENHGI